MSLFLQQRPAPNLISQHLKTAHLDLIFSSSSDCGMTGLFFVSLVCALLYLAQSRAPHISKCRQFLEAHIEWKDEDILEVSNCLGRAQADWLVHSHHALFASNFGSLKVFVFCAFMVCSLMKYT
ncbi:hypothetical protein B0T25DRAFT_544507, partial [Lasiosphaeria hispida]